jgi:dihydroxy-acid dehydratase
MVAIARHMGVEHSLEDWQRLGPDVPLLVDCQPAGRYLGEKFHRAGGVPAVMKELLDAGRLNASAMTVTGKTLGDNLAAVTPPDRDVIRAYGEPLKASAGYVVMSGNLFETAVMKTSVIDAAFRERFLSNPDRPNVFEGKAIVFEGPEDYHARIEDPDLGVEDQSVLIIRNCGPIGYPGGAEVVNMQPPASLLARGISTLPTMGDGRQSGTSAAPSILNVSPEAAIGGGLALLETGDRIRIDLNTRKVDVLLPEGELEARRAKWKPPVLVNKTPWEEIYRSMVGQQGTGACLEPATLYLDVLNTRGESRNNH